MSTFYKFPSIESFANVYKGQQRFEDRAVVQYGAKIKLHGTNAAVVVTSGGAEYPEVYAQSRSRVITPEDDNAGFAKWVETTAPVWQNCTAEGAPDIIFYGEWAGKGVQKGDAVTQLNDKYFFVFAIQIDDEMITAPVDIEDCIPDLDNVIVLPWDMVFEVPVDFNDPDQCQSFADLLNDHVKRVAERDPFIHGIFGIDGPGEGFVVSPVCNPGDDPLEGSLSRDWYSALSFKVKTEAHSVKHVQKAASVKVEVPEDVKAFVSAFVTPARCEQGLTEACGGEAVPEKTGAFIKWMIEDVLKESKDEIEEANFEFKDVQKPLVDAVKRWFIAKTREI